ncbi:hypothetical protein QAD02_004538, partial [Eretmocerus hayati]
DMKQNRIYIAKLPETKVAEEEEILPILQQGGQRIGLDNLPLSLSTFQRFMEKSRGTKNFKELALKYTENSQYLISMIDLLYPLIGDSAYKARCTRVKEKVEGKPTSESENELDNPSTRGNPNEAN